MKKLLILLLVLLLTGCGGPGDAPDTGDTQPPVKTVFVHNSISRIQGQTRTRTEYIYNEEDLLTDVIVYDAEDRQLQRYLVERDENGNPVTWSTVLNGVGSTLEYTYDSHGHLLGTYAYTDDVLTTSTEYTWSGELRISVIVKAAAQGFEQRTEYTYDDKGVLQRQDLYVGGALSGYGLYQNDASGKATLCENFDPEGNSTGTVSFSYNGISEKRITTDAHGTVIQTQELTYDLHGNLLSSHSYDGSGQLLFAEVHTWNTIQVPAELPRAGI